MRRFVAKSGLFVALVAGCLLAISVASRHVRKKLLEDRVFFLGSHVTTLAMGDSHPQSSINPARWQESANLCEGQENYLFTYNKLVHFLRHNPQVTRVILGFSYHNLARRYQELFITSEREGSRLLGSYFMLLDEPSVELVRDRTRGSRAYYLNLLKFRYGLPIQVYLDKDFLRVAAGASLRREDVRFFGSGFHDSDKSKLDDNEMAVKARKYFLDESGRYSGVSALMTDYLEKIARLCQARGIELYLYNAPLHPRFKPRIPEQAVADFARAKLDLLAKFPGTHYVDLVDEPLPSDAFGDGDHVNSRGASVVTDRLVGIAR